MNSPFPGMDPYLEAHWRDVHTRFMVYASNQLNQQLPGDLQARVEESLAVEVDDKAERLIYPDVQVVETSGPSDSLESEESPASLAVAEQFEVSVRDVPPPRYVAIIDSSNNRLVTAIELLSPSNKASESGRRKYRRKQAEYIQAGVNLVEIDLLRAGEFVLAMPEDDWPAQHQATYRVCIRRLEKPHRAAGISISLREPLPNIPIPLRPTDPEAVLALQPIIDDCYRDGRYSTLDYSRPLDPPLDGEDAAWFSQQLRERAP